MTKKITPEQTQLELPIEPEIQVKIQLKLNPQYATIATLCEMFNLLGVQISKEAYDTLPEPLKGHFVYV